MKFANIIVDISLEKLDRTFQYRVPEELQGILKEGMQVRIPFGNGGRTLTGYVLELTDTCEWDEKKLKPILGLAEKGIRLFHAEYHGSRLVNLTVGLQKSHGLFQKSLRGFCGDSVFLRSGLHCHRDGFF